MDGGNVLGTTTGTLLLTNVQTNDAGVYTIVVTNAFGFALSSNAVLTVIAPPTILTQPTNQTVLAGSMANLSVTANGTPPLNYQWQFNSTNLVDATNATLALTNVMVDQAGAYSVTVTNLAGSVTSSNAVLSVYPTAASALNQASFTSDSGVQFTISGMPGFQYAVQATTNLIDWESLVTNTSPFSFADTNLSGIPQRFYRTVYVP